MDSSSNENHFTPIEIEDDELMNILIDNTLVHKVLEHSKVENEDFNVYSHDDMKNISIEQFMEDYNKHGKMYLANKPETKSQNSSDNMIDSKSSLISSTSSIDSIEKKTRLPNICCYCGIKKKDHHTPLHRYIRVKHEYKCIKCGLFFFQHHTKDNKCTFLPYEYING